MTLDLDLGPPCPGAADPAQTMLGPTQKEWIAERFAPSATDRTCLAQQTVRPTFAFRRPARSSARWTAEFRTVDDIADPDSAASSWKTFVVERGTNTVTAR